MKLGRTSSDSGGPAGTTTHKGGHPRQPEQPATGYVPCPPPRRLVHRGSLGDRGLLATGKGTVVPRRARPELGRGGSTRSRVEPIDGGERPGNLYSIATVRDRTMHDEGSHLPFAQARRARRCLSIEFAERSAASAHPRNDSELDVNPARKGRHPTTLEVLAFVVSAPSHARSVGRCALPSLHRRLEASFRSERYGFTGRHEGRRMRPLGLYDPNPSVRIQGSLTSHWCRRSGCTPPAAHRGVVWATAMCDPRLLLGEPSFLPRSTTFHSHG